MTTNKAQLAAEALGFQNADLMIAHFKQTLIAGGLWEALRARAFEAGDIVQVTDGGRFHGCVLKFVRMAPGGAFECARGNGCEIVTAQTLKFIRKA